jgi:carbohydrate-binding DOMON domain-containing protein
MKVTIILLALMTFLDPTGDDFGPGTYKYPTDAVYKRGSFDLRKVEIQTRGSTVEFRVTLGQRIEDPWNSREWPTRGNGFSLQMVQIYLDTTIGAGFRSTLPGINAAFGKQDAWDKVVVISPQGAARLRAEIRQKAGAMKKAVVVPTRVRVRGKTLIATVKKSDLGGAPAKHWGVQAVMQSNEGFPKGNDLLSRRVNEYPGKHRFGGGSDYTCDPHIIDILAGRAKGLASEKAAQRKALSYQCGPDGKSLKKAILPMMRQF